MNAKQMQTTSAIRRANDRQLIAVKIASEEKPIVARLVRGTAFPSETTIRIRRLNATASELVRVREIEGARLVGTIEAQIAAALARAEQGTGEPE